MEISLRWNGDIRSFVQETTNFQNYLLNKKTWQAPSGVARIMRDIFHRKNPKCLYIINLFNVNFFRNFDLIFKTRIFILRPLDFALTKEAAAKF